MRRTIGLKIFIYMFIFSVVIIAVIGLSVKFVLPVYYTQKQIDSLEKAEAEIVEAYSSDNIEYVMEVMESVRNDLGGELYYYAAATGQQGYGIGMGRNRVTNPNSEKFTPTGEVTVYQYVNKVGLEIYVLGVLVDSSYLVYEVGIQSLARAADTMMSFFGVLLAMVLFVALLVSYALSRKISKPIRDLNALAESMKNKDVEPFLVTRDQDEISELNQTLNELYEELKGNIYKLNAEISKERNAEKLKKRFLAQATHELKTPIAVIRGYAEILYDGMYKDEEERERFLKNIYDETEALSHLILDVLDYTKMETGNYQLAREKLTVKPFLASMFNRYKDFVESHGLTLILEENVSEGFVKEMDRVRYEQVYKNLISNAVEHGMNTVKVNVQTAGEKLRLCVFNDGESIAEEDLPNVFESFYKREGKQSGTGLGLAIVKEIVLLHGGDYRVENVSGGVEFVVVL